VVVRENESMDVPAGLRDEARLHLRLGNLARSAAGEGRGRVSTTLMSDVRCMGSGEKARIRSSRKGFCD
jgi:hypothetical protein